MKHHILSGFSSVGRAFDCRGLFLILLVSNCRWFDSGKPELNKNNIYLLFLFSNISRIKYLMEPLT